MEQGEMRGVIGEAATGIFQDAKIPFIWRNEAIKRQINIILQNKTQACISGAYKTGLLASQGKYTKAIYTNQKFRVVTRPSLRSIKSGMSLQELFSNRTLVLETKFGQSLGTELDQLISLYDPVLVVSSSDNISTFKKLLKGRIDYFFATSSDIAHLIESGLIKSQDIRLVHIRDMPSTETRYLVCSQQVPDRIMAKLNSAISRYMRLQVDKDIRVDVND